MLAFVLASCAPPGAGTVADSPDKSATATSWPTPTPLPASTKSAASTPLPTQTDVQPAAAPTYTPTTPPAAAAAAPSTNTAMPLPQIAPTLPPTTEVNWEETNPPVGLQYEDANWIKIQAPRELTILAVYFIPEGEGPFPVVIILYGTMGLREIHVQLAQDYAESGFVAMAGSWFGGHYRAVGGNQPPAETEHSDDIDWPDGPDIRRGSHPQAVEDVVALVEAARTLPTADSSRIGLYGHSRGSEAAIATAASGVDIQAVVAVAGYPTNISFRELEAPVLILQGTDDKFVGPAQALQFEEKLITLGKTVTTHIIEGAPHEGHTTLPWSIEVLNMASSFYSEYLKTSSTATPLPTNTPLPPPTPTATPVPVETATPIEVYKPDGPILGQQLWRFKTGGVVHSAPAISGGVVYVGSRRDVHLYALDAGSGEEKWRFNTGDQAFSPPAVSGGLVIFGTSDHYLYALDAGSGQEKWRFKTGKSVHSSPAISGGVVYFGSFDNYLYALDAGSGQEKWRFKTGDQVGSSPAVAGGVVYFGSQDSHLYALDASTGHEKWRFKTGHEVRSSPAVAGGVVYFGSKDGHLYALDAGSGHEKWRFNTGDMVHANSAVSGGVVYFDSWTQRSEGHLYALDAATGQEKWKVPTETLGEVDTSPAISDGVVYVGSFDGHLYALDAGTGQEKWEFPTGDRVHANPVVSGGVVYFGSYDGYMYALK